MKRALKSTIAFLLILTAGFFLPETLTAQGQTPEIQLPVDYVTPDLEIPVSPSGGTATIHIICYSGFNETTLLDNIQSSLESCSIGWVTNVYLTNREGIYEADLNFDFSENLSDETQQFILSASNGSSLIYQPAYTPNVYNLLPASPPPVYLLHGGKNTLTLSSSDGFASYRLLKDTANNVTITVAEADGKSTGNRALRFDVTSPGNYYCIAYYPTEVQMNGSSEVRWHKFYTDYNRNCSISPNPYTFSRDGGSVSFTYNVANAQDSILQRIVNFYNSGNCTIWDTTMNLSCTRLSSTQVRITVEAGPNLAKAQLYPQPNDIVNNTYFKNSSGNEIIFTQPAGGEIKAYNVSLPGSAGSVLPYLILDSTQCRVRYAIFRDGVQYGPARTGHGDSLHLAIPADSGKFNVVAFYAGKTRRMKGTLTVMGDGKAIWGENWILKQTYTAENGAASFMDITYHDGLGYPAQVINVGASPSGKNIVTPVWYDQMRREDARAYLPYASADSYAPQPEEEPLQKQKTFYTNLYGNNDANYAYTEKVYENSPLNRVQRQFSPGADFRAAGANPDHCTSFAYESNAQNEVLDISCEDNGDLTIRGYLSSAKLFRTSTTSPDGRTTSEFKDSEGTLYLQRSGSGADIQETYYAYDGRRRLRWVIQPEGSARIKVLAANSSSANPYTIIQADSTAQKFCFLYAYDGRNQMSGKKIPGKGLEYMIYDRAGRLVATQDSILRSQNSRWMLTRYDSLGRVTDVFRSSPMTMQLVKSGFSQSAYPIFYTYAGNTVLSSALYGKEGDTFTSNNVYSSDIPSYLAFEEVQGVAEEADIDSRTASMLLYDKTLDMTTLASNPKRYRERAYYYDKKGRVIQTVEKMPDGEIIRTSVKYDFVGNPLTTVQSLEKGTNTTIQDNTGIGQDGKNTLTQVFTYDSRGRKLTSATYLNNSLSDTWAAANYSYDELGRLISAENGKTSTQGSSALSPSTTAPVLSNILAYNIQGWMTSQTDILKKGTAQSTHKSLYSQTLRYHNPIKTATQKSYDGLITEWETVQYSNGTDFTAAGSTQDKNTYSFSYDGFGRLTSSSRYAGGNTNPNSSFTEKNFSYDKNGNILTLTRYGAGDATIKDSFTYSYSGNRIEKLEGTHDGSAITHIVQNNSVSGTADYLYDGNGNMTFDALRHISMTYDLNNLVSTVSRDGNPLSAYTYLADGTKYKVKDSDGNGRYYIGPFCLSIEKTGTGSSAQTKAFLESIDAETGRILAIRQTSETGANTTETTSYSTVFFVKDHLGSVRAVVDSQGHILERNAYYPFGLQMTIGKAYPTISSSLTTLYPNIQTSTQARRDLYNGKELQTAAGTDYIDYGFRQYDPVTARWMAVDPMSEVSIKSSPYHLCDNCPISKIDYNGLLWKDERKVDKLTGSIDNKINEHNKEINKLNHKLENSKKEKKRNKIEKRIEELYYMNNKLEETKETIRMIGEKPELYDLSYHNNNGEHYITNDKGVYVIHGSTNDLLVHELKHIRQYFDLEKDLDFTPSNEGTQYLMNPGDNKYYYCALFEVEAYKSQYAFSGKFPVPGVNSIFDIDIVKVANIKNDNNSYIYEYIRKLIGLPLLP